MKIKVNEKQLQALVAVLWHVKLGDVNEFEGALSDLMVDNDELFTEAYDAFVLAGGKVKFPKVEGDRTIVLKQKDVIEW